MENYIEHIKKFLTVPIIIVGGILFGNIELDKIFLFKKENVKNTLPYNTKDTGPISSGQGISYTREVTLSASDLKKAIHSQQEYKACVWNTNQLPQTKQSKNPYCLVSIIASLDRNTAKNEQVELEITTHAYPGKKSFSISSLNVILNQKASERIQITIWQNTRSFLEDKKHLEWKARKGDWWPNNAVVEMVSTKLDPTTKKAVSGDFNPDRIYSSTSMELEKQLTLTIP